LINEAIGIGDGDGPDTTDAPAALEDRDRGLMLGIVFRVLLRRGRNEGERNIARIILSMMEWYWLTVIVVLYDSACSIFV
jgi:hypothetical protein